MTQASGRKALTPREQQILAAVRQGLSNAQIGRDFRISEETVKRHLGNIFDKVGCSSRTELVWMTREEALEAPEVRAQLDAARQREAALQAGHETRMAELRRELEAQLAESRQTSAALTQELALYRKLYRELLKLSVRPVKPKAA